jgi:hypothetical protein
MMRHARLFGIGVSITVAACAHDERRQVAVPPPIEKAASPAPAPNEYLIADASPTGRRTIALPIGSGLARGLVVGKRRIIVGQGEPRMAADSPAEALNGAAKIPRRFGGGFLFWTATSLYRADAFDGQLVPIAFVPDAIETVSFMPKALLVRTHNGERWGVGLPKGERAPVGGPLGIVDVEALDDGRAVAFNDQGAVFTSVDHGTHWTDATAHVKSSPTKVTEIGGDLWIFESNGGASRLEGDGRLSWFDKPPVESAFELRPHDPRWHGNDQPLRAVLRFGAAIDDATGIAIDGGNLVRVDLRSGDILSVVPGRLPPDALCEAVPLAGDVLFACGTQSGNTFIASHTLSGDAPLIEQTFGVSSTVYAGIDGGVAFGGPCQGSASNADRVVCVRTPGGHWEEHDLSGFTSDAGASAVHVARWVPRVDGRVVAVVVEPNPGIYDPVSGSFQPLGDEVRELATAESPSHAYSRHGKMYVRRANGGLVDTSWSFTNSGTLRGWRSHGGAFEIGEDGKLTHSPYSFDVKFAGTLGIGKSTDGRLYQSNDFGVSWVEVAAPPSGADGLDLTGCTSAGCDLGAFYRVGWPTRAPHVEPTSAVAPRAAEVPRVRGLELTCKPAGAPVAKMLPRTGDSPDDLGLGANRLPVATGQNSEWSFVRNAVPRGIISPIHEAPSGEGDSTAALRAMLTGFATTRDGDVISTVGPNKNVLALRRGLSFVAPFDPAGKVVRASIAMSDVVAAGRRAGLATDEILAEDFTESGAVIPLASHDPAAPSEIALHNVDHGLIAFARGERVRVAVRPNPNGTNVVSGVSTGPDEAAFLEVDSSGVGHVFKVGVGITDLFDVSPTANDSLYGANPDALAVGPKGDLAVLRTPSGSDPASSFDPAYLIIPAAAPVPLAPWSDVRFADDAACKAETGGYRAVLQLIGPWVRFTNPELRVEDVGMLARVRWTPKRVCLEGFEVKGPSVNIRAPGASGTDPLTLATWIVARGSTFARVGISEGAEWRQPLECSVVSTGP